MNQNILYTRLHADAPAFQLLKASDLLYLIELLRIAAEINATVMPVEAIRHHRINHFYQRAKQKIGNSDVFSAENEKECQQLCFFHNSDDKKPLLTVCSVTIVDCKL